MTRGAPRGTPLHHLTFNSGHVAQLARPSDNDVSRRRLRRLVQEGGGLIPGDLGRAGYQCYLIPAEAGRGSCYFQVTPPGVRRDVQTPLILTAITCWDEAEQAVAWTTMRDHAVAVTAPMRAVGMPIPPVQIAPPSLPWLAVLLLPDAFMRPGVDLHRIAAFERHLAWAIIAAAETKRRSG